MKTSHIGVLCESFSKDFLNVKNVQIFCLQVFRMKRELL